MAVRTVISALFAVAALLLVVLAPAVALAHGGMSHVHAARKVSESQVLKGATGQRVTVLRAQPASQDIPATRECDGRDCCGAGHCSGCGIGIAPGMWSGLRLPPDGLSLSPDATRPATLAREGPPRPPKIFV